MEFPRLPSLFTRLSCDVTFVITDITPYVCTYDESLGVKEETRKLALPSFTKTRLETQSPNHMLIVGVERRGPKERLLRVLLRRPDQGPPLHLHKIFFF